MNEKYHRDDLSYQSSHHKIFHNPHSKKMQVTEDSQKLELLYKKYYT